LSAAICLTPYDPAPARGQTENAPTAVLACPCPSCGGNPLSSGKPKAETTAPTQCPLDAKECCQAKSGNQAKAKPCCKLDPRVAGDSTELKTPTVKPIELTNIGQLKEKFNQDVGTPRMVLLFSTTCPVCVDGAQRIQREILAKHPKAKLKLYVIWEQMLPTDVLRKTREDLITDDRATHFKDTKRVTGRWFSKNMKDCPSLGEIAWDAFYLYDADAKWDKTPQPTMACGTPVVKDWQALSKAISPLLNP
jgi:hypothetical protein